ncbi:HlyD family efflux transporter periplasmic adaptor subunit [Erythrobacter sp. HL-111]|uniref:HlyD family efflux transporter periplasmic adaptor subunit n=1 Tax=Erythrobacter sp. HL-111 TaxID=1798193 RepID=UPI0006D9FA48|nr:HlyD family efflux transporter periplasmic adaptor subunit [Erythrobacter sp. HL-111]KPP91220.1 MAG: HAE1 family RND-type efflux pump membrane fusion component [Erythrobacteraceae bacterium HL-111]SDT06301.1 RND family efflux transporter, MFP subunit [Erythrobacter sp. HL-111]
MAEEAGTREDAPDKRKWRLIALAVLLVGLAGAAALWFLRPQQQEEEPPDRPPLVSVTRIERESEPLRVSGRGDVRPASEVGLSLQVSGEVVWVNPRLREGERVRRGETLLRVDPGDYTVRVEEARAEVERARVELAEAEESGATREEEFERLRDRIEGESAGPPDGIESDFLRPGEGEQATAELAEEPSPLALGQPQVDAARAALAGARARLESARRDVARTRLTAPFDAVVRSKSVERGQFVRPGEVLAGLYDAGSIEVAVPLIQRKAALIPRVFAPVTSGTAAGGPATVRVDFGGTRWAWEAMVEGAEGAIDPATRTLDVVVRVARPLTGARAVRDGGEAGDPPPLLPGFFADVEFLARTPPAYFEIPRDALRAEDRVWAVRDGALAFVPVTVVAREGASVFVTGEELADGERIVTGEVPSATEGMEVRTDEGRSAPALDARESGGVEPAIDEGGA